MVSHVLIVACWLHNQKLIARDEIPKLRQSKSEISYFEGLLSSC